MADESSFLGKQLGSYRIVGELSSGTYGSVYTGKHLIFEDDPMVAMKVLHAHLGSPQERTQFIREAQLLKKLKHPFILPILDASIQEGVAYIVTEYATGGSLRDHLNQHLNQPIPLEEALTILSQVGQALEHAHQHNIVHRDLKPANILFNARKEALLADFGIAVILATAGTRQLGNGGTPAYMAPEQFEGIVSMKSDQYALGCIAYELVTGRRPFNVEQVCIEAVWYQHAKVAPPAPRQLNAHLPIHIEQAILQAMAKQRADRHPTISAFLNALQKSFQQWVNEGKSLYDLERYEEAIAALEQAIRLDPNNARAYYNKGVSLHDLKRYDEALAAYDQALRLDPNYAKAYHNKGVALERLGKKQEAEQAYNRARQLGYNG